MDPHLYQPHREQLPRRHCMACEAILSTGNLMELCFACGKTWGLSQDQRIVIAPTKSRHRREIAYALDELLA